ncbi:unnamed protein product [Clavelina lepadiformis]|uniref:N-acylglucosamine 2-epimerase n=1 Tax=Clavelina lepadiformis TaxID=159417 RepID=A0ABP0GB37_CLALP
MDPEYVRTLQRWCFVIEEELDKVLDFWQKYSHDTEHGGFFTCLDKDGKIYDETKYVWLQARQVWMYCKLYNEVPKYANDQILQPALKGAQFLLNNCLISRDGCKRCAFSVTKGGKAIKIQRTLFSECFFVMAMSEAWRSTKEEIYQDAAVTMMMQIYHWCLVDDSALGRESLPGSVPMSSLAVPMMALCLCHQIETCAIEWSHSKATTLKDWAIGQMLNHVKRGGAKVLENISPDGKEISGSIGRVQIPGHTIECGWFLLRHAMKIGDDELAEKAIQSFISAPFEQGWDDEYGGILYFTDADGFPPTQLEWNMKLWWPHNEAMIAFLLAYVHTKKEIFIKQFDKVAQYSFEKFVDKEHGEWFGYLHQDGRISSRFKGATWKGCFHIPRSLLMCKQLLSEILNK